MSKFFNKFNKSDSDVNTDVDTKDVTPEGGNYPALIQKTAVGTYSGLTIGSGLSVSSGVLNVTTGVTRASVYVATASTITIPTNAKGMLVTLIGSGGNGGGSAAVTTAGVGGGGGAGGMTVLYLQNVQNYNTFKVTFGTGTGSSIDFAFNDNASTPNTYTISAYNGADGSVNSDTDNPSLGGAGGVAFTSIYSDNKDIQCYAVGGANGASGFIVPSTSQVYVSGAGAASIFGGAGVGAVVLTDSAGVDAVAFGSGGSGSVVTGSAATLSSVGAGAPGFCLIEYIA